MADDARKVTFRPASCGLVGIKPLQIDVEEVDTHDDINSIHFYLLPPRHLPSSTFVKFARSTSNRLAGSPTCA